MYIYIKKRLKAITRNSNNNDCEWFNEMYKNGWKPCMDAHRDCCRGVFDFDNYDKWVESLDEDYPLPCDNCGESMKYHNTNSVHTETFDDLTVCDKCENELEE